MKSLIILAVVAIIGTQSNYQNSQTLSLTIKGIKKQGTLMIGVYNNSEGFGNTAKTFKKVKTIASSNEIKVELNDLPKNNYAIAIFQDLNNNGKLDKNFIGKPTEPYGFSNNVRPLFSAPTFYECKFTFKDNRNIEITLINP